MRAALIALMPLFAACSATPNDETADTDAAGPAGDATTDGHFVIDWTLTPNPPVVGDATLAMTIVSADGEPASGAKSTSRSRLPSSETARPGRTSRTSSTCFSSAMSTTSRSPAESTV
jgi:hypothetical protein